MVSRWFRRGSSPSIAPLSSARKAESSCSVPSSTSFSGCPAAPRTVKAAWPAIGIDLGTTNSCVAVWSQGRVEIIPNSQGHSITPSCVAFAEDGTTLVGDAAKDQATCNAANTLFQVKRWIGRRYRDVTTNHALRLWPYKLVCESDGGGFMIEVETKNGRETYFPEEISAKILEELKVISEAYLDCDVKNAVISVPANFTQSQKAATRAAARLAGLNVIRLITEPSAAALAYAMRSNALAGGCGYGARERGRGRGRGGRRSVGDRISEDTNILKIADQAKLVMIIDWGGGTLDVSIMRVDNREFTVVGVAGDTCLGGQDIDDAMMMYFADQINAVHGVEIYDDPRTMRRLRSYCEQMKHALSFSMKNVIVVDALCRGEDFKLELTREKLEELCEPIFHKCLGLVSRSLEDASLDRSEVAKVILAGGSMRVPKIQQMLAEYFSEGRLCRAIHPEECVASGAAVQAALLTGEADMDVVDVAVVEAVPITIGVGCVEGKLIRLIDRNTPYPKRVIQDWVAGYDGQESFAMQVYEGERERCDENHFVGEVVIEGLRPGPAGSGMERVPLQCALEIDEDGMLTATITDKISKRRVSKSLGRSWGRFEDGEAKALVRVASKMAEQDQADVAKLTARHQLKEFTRREKWRLSMIPTEEERKRASDLLDAEEDWWERNRGQLFDVCEYDKRKKLLQQALLG
ncbi:hypothetical protein CBR_g4848 [Chara braunii]|uniref:Uncharacterized protein n=1 Tax=Chara braunii TaxID=69332 RepID=A0A388KIY5_CHABU|nr:hypothetical protein CBR_g4848 [Chara braunii]|eukprot:GBG70021.1 hypothetical protein CBR_g4848 [Chara braunii]